MANLVQSGVASAERVFELLDAAGAGAGPGDSRPRREQVARQGRVRRGLVPLRPDKPLIEDLSISGRAGADGGHRRPDRRRQDHPGQPADAVLRGGLRGRSRWTASTSPRCPATSCAQRSAWCCRTPGCSAAPSRRTSPTARTTPTRERIIEAAVATHVDRFVRTLPDGYDTVIDDEGSGLSRGGEAADHDRPGVPVRAGDPDPGRGDQFGGHPHRGADPAGHDVAASGADQLRHRAPAVHHPRRRRDPGDGARADRRAGHP